MFFNKSSTNELIIAIIASLFLFTGASKFLHFESFKSGMRAQPLTGWLSSLLVLLLPPLELCTAVGMLFYKTRWPSLMIFILMMSSYTVYTALIVFKFFSSIPCGCGSVFPGLSWFVHLIINVFFLSIAVLILTIYNTKKVMHNQEVS